MRLSDIVPRPSLVESVLDDQTARFSSGIPMSVQDGEDLLAAVVGDLIHTTHFQHVPLPTYSAPGRAGDLNTIPAILQEFRRRYGFTQADMAERLGCSLSVYYYYESQGQTRSPKTTLVLRDLLEKTDMELYMKYISIAPMMNPEKERRLRWATGR